MLPVVTFVYHIYDHPRTMYVIVTLTTAARTDESSRFDGVDPIIATTIIALRRSRYSYICIADYLKANRVPGAQTVRVRRRRSAGIEPDVDG